MPHAWLRHANSAISPRSLSGANDLFVKLSYLSCPATGIEFFVVSRSRLKTMKVAYRSFQEAMRDLESIEHLRVWSTESGPPEHMECSLQEISVSKLIRVIFVWPWNENAQMNGNRSIWLACLRDKIAFGFWLVKQMLSWKNFMPKELLTNQSILHFDVMLQHQSNNSFSISGFSLAGSSFFDLFIHWLIKQIMNIYQNHFSRSYK